ncbi:UCH domain-containing protein [Cephalotus follicularis]|uniref:UCH domain-containing protein n=1 Tax=Cephalotus follicularis TaxID=3775 RepID=A0A1Q3CQG5_CEPFO|nr:UCH domain-containing protein [Cephalotus follicularis]
MKFDDSKIPFGRKTYLRLNPLRDFFLCSTISILSCSNCSYTSSQTETCYALSLGITAEMSLAAALSFFNKMKELADVLCDGCKQRVKAEKKILLEKGVPFLIIQLSKFYSSEDKIKGYIAFPLLLDMTPYCSSPSDMEYELYSFIVHVGETDSLGHYYAFVSMPSLWYKLNDEDFDEVDIQAVLKQDAYILFYKRRTLDITILPSYSDSFVELLVTRPVSALLWEMSPTRGRPGANNPALLNCSLRLLRNAPGTRYSKARGESLGKTRNICGA